MHIKDIHQIGVVGAGQMGTGIVQELARAHWDVLLHDTSDQVLGQALSRIYVRMEKAGESGDVTSLDVERMHKRIHTTTSLEAMEGVQFVIEAVPENPDLKGRIFEALGRICSPDVVLTSNTSSISITRLAAISGRPEMVAGLHFMNPVPVMKLVEIIHGERTSQETISLLLEVAARMGKIPVEAKDSPGFIVNRVLMPMVNEAIFAYADGIATKEAIDTAMVYGTNHPMGPLALADRIGLDTVLSICEILYHEFGDPKYRPCPLLRQYVAAGWLGRKSGKGFYTYEVGRGLNTPSKVG